MPENSSVHGRLDSWKEIADYLKRDVRTAIRWGKDKGMPVHRVPGGKRQAVFAYKEEIDAWLVSQDIKGKTPNQDEVGDGIEEPTAGEHSDLSSGTDKELKGLPHRPPGDQPSESGHRRIIPAIRPLNRALFGVIAGLLVVVGVISVLLARSRASITAHPPNFHQITNDGLPKSTLRTDGKNLYFNETQGARTVLMSAPMSGSPIRAIDTPFANVWLQDLSNDGKTLLVSSFEGIENEGPLWTIPVQGGTERPVGDARCGVARWSPDNRRIACTRGTSIMVLNSDGAATHLVRSFTSPIGGLSWTPDGMRLRFVLLDTTAHTGSLWEIAVNEDGAATQEHRLPFGATCCSAWTWIQNGKTFVYVLIDPDGKAHVMTGPEKGLVNEARETKLTVEIRDVLTMASTRTGNTLYLVTNTANRGELWKFDTMQGAPHTFLPGLSAAYIAYSPDGRWMTYQDTVDLTLWRSRVDGSEALQLTKTAMEVEVSSWSPDGRRIAYMGRASGRPWRIFLIDRDGGLSQEAAEGSDNQGGPSWSPDGKTIVYGSVFCRETQSCGIRRMDVASRKVEILPESQGLRTARWSPDGKYIAALHPETHELMLFDVKSQRWRALADSVTGDNVNWSSDSRYVFVDSPSDKKPVVERVRVKDGRRFTVVSLATLEKVPGLISGWIGLTPDNSPILLHMLNTSEIYAVEWTEH